MNPSQSNTIPSVAYPTTCHNGGSLPCPTEQTRLVAHRQPLLGRAPSRLQKGVAALFEAALQERDRAESCYDEGEALLLSSLGLNKLNLSPSLFYVRHYSNTTTAGRVDAEYFSPRYQRVLNHLRQGGQTIGDVAPLAERKFQAEAGATFS